MTVEILTPQSREEWLELRMSTIGASETPAILGVHPYMTPFKLWARKRGIEFGDNKQTRRGRLLEPVAIELLREERPEWDVMPNVIGHGGKFYSSHEAGLSCTPDAFVIDNLKLGICQIKTVNPHTFQTDWMVDGDVQLPPYVAIQAMQEMHLTGASWGCVFAVVGFDLDTHLIEVKPHAGIIERIKREVPEFLRRVRENDPPGPDYGRDGAAIAALYAEDDGGTIDLSGNESALVLVNGRESFKQIEAGGAEAAKARKEIDAELIHMLGNAARGTLADGRVIEAATVRRKGFTVEPTSYRAVKIKTPKRSAA